MIPLFVFFVHVVGVAAIFTKRWQEEGLAEGILGVVFALLIFFVGWSMTAFILKFVMQPEGFGRWFDRDAASLLLLTVVEGIFYYFYLRNDLPEEEPAEQRGNRDPFNPA